MSAKNKLARGYTVPLKLVSASARDYGIALPDLQTMLRKSTPITHPKGNRRYHDYVFMVSENRVTSITHLSDTQEEPDEQEDTVFFDEKVYKCETCKDNRKVQVFNECPRCQGEGCQRCEEGLVPSAIPCPDCKAQKTLFRNHK